MKKDKRRLTAYVVSLTRLGRTALHCYSEITIGIHLLKREEVVVESKKHKKTKCYKSPAASSAHAPRTDGCWSPRSADRTSRKFCEKDKFELSDRKFF